MKKHTFTLHGFANGGGAAPQFIEPVFIRNENLYVQSCQDQSKLDIITDFVAFSDNIEVFESNTNDKRKIGSHKLFSVRDIGDRIICLDRDSLSKYLVQNLNSYIAVSYTHLTLPTKA